MKFFRVCIFLHFFFCSYSYSQSDFAASAEKNSVTTPEESSQEPTLQIGDTQNFVWRIYRSNSSGTAFPIGPSLFVTNFHVLYLMLEEESSIKDIALHQKGDVFHLTIKRVVAVSVLYDLVLFETEESVTNYLNISDIPVRPNDELLIPGYPQRNFKEMKKTGKAMNVDDNDHYVFPVDHFELKGSSGSPVLNVKEQVIGVVSKVFGNILIMVKSNHLRSLIVGEIGLNCSDIIQSVMCIKEEIKNLRKLTEQGYAPAQYNLSLMYSNGVGTERNLELAFYWMQESAKQNFFLAQHNLAMMYYKGEGVEKNLKLAFHWYRESAKQGYAPAQYNLAQKYYNGEGTERNLELAVHWWVKSAQQGAALSQYELAVMYYKGEDVKKNLELAFFWIQQSAEQGYAKSQSNLAQMYYNGEGTERNLELAFHWWKESAKQGDALAQYNLSLMYSNEEGTERNLELAFHWMQESAKQNFFLAQQFLEEFYKRLSQN